MSRPMAILRCATTNPGKLNEFRMAAAQFGCAVEIQPLEDLKKIAPPEEEGESFEENAIEKALYYSVFCEEPLFADDSGLEVDALDGAPGIRSARYAGPDATDRDNNRLLLARLRDATERTARFVCVIALAQQGKLLGTFRGVVEGRISDEERGPRGFGYDPLFYFEPFGCTFGQVEAARKMEVSHRGQALAGMLASFATSL
ncbi:MAG: RdgB/HAM1 family non-canonical purine NTP pyrophosphatase [Bryobacteraceae bacterium]